MNPVIVVPLAYGADADITALSDLARASLTNVQSGRPENIAQVVAIISRRCRVCPHRYSSGDFSISA